MSQTWSTLTSTQKPSPLALWRWKLHWQILVGLVLGALVGWAMGAHAVAHLPQGTDPAKINVLAANSVTGSTAYLILQILADLFVAALKLLVVPLVISSIILAVARLKSGSDLGRLGLKTLAYYLCTSLIAVLIGLIVVDLVKPGIGPSGQGILKFRDLSQFHDAQSHVAGAVLDRPTSALPDFFHRLIPANIFSAAATDQLLGLIVVSLVIGFILGRQGTDSAHLVVRFTQGVYDVTMKICEFLLALSPIGVLALLAVTVARHYAQLVPEGRFGDLATGLLWFAAAALVGLALHMFVVLFLGLRFVARVNPLRHFRAILPAVVAGFSTASSQATLPLNMECVEERAGVSRSTTSFVLPLGAAIHRDGTALYACIAAVFLCQAFGLHLSFAQQLMVVGMALLTSIGVAGVPAASLVAIVIILQALQPDLATGSFPEGGSLIAGMGLLFIVDRPLDMFRTAVNVYSDACGATIVAKAERELLARIS